MIDPATYCFMLSTAGTVVVAACYAALNRYNRKRGDWWAKQAEDGLTLSRTCLEQRDDANARATDLEDRLRRIERQRSDAVRKGNLTRSAKRKAAIAATTSELQQNIADRAEPVRIAA